MEIGLVLEHTNIIDERVGFVSAQGNGCLLSAEGSCSILPERGEQMRGVRHEDRYARRKAMALDVF